ncbi:MAG: 1,4-dihydroxy-2-naphthoate polyprenyltransferase, partial [Pseudomonadota bacterium]
HSSMTAKPQPPRSSLAPAGTAAGPVAAGRAGAAPRRGYRWWVAARPRTLTMAVTPVVVGASLAWAEGAEPAWFVLLLTLACAMLIQVATNFLNDVTDFEKGNDRADRVGPVRITAAGWATPREVRRAAKLCVGLALAVGLVLVLVGGWPILAIGLLSIAAAWAYSGGRRPVSYGMLGELYVLAFFGVIAVAGTYYLQAGRWSATSVPVGLGVGAMAAAVLLLNNYRDLAADAAAGRRTLAARLGPAGSRTLYAALMLLPLTIPPWLALAHGVSPAVWLAWLAAPLCLVLVARSRHAAGTGLNPVLGQTALAQFAFGLLLSAGLVL